MACQQDDPGEQAVGVVSAGFAGWSRGAGTAAGWGRLQRIEERWQPIAAIGPLARRAADLAGCDVIRVCRSAVPIQLAAARMSWLKMDWQ